MAHTSSIDLMDLDPFVEGRDGELFRTLRDEDPCHWNDEPDGPGFWSLTRYEDVKAVAGDWQTFSSAQGTQIESRRAEGHGKPSIHNMDPPRHKPLRALLTEWLEPAATGTPEQCVARVEREFSLGADRVILHGATPDELAPIVDAYRTAGAA